MRRILAIIVLGGDMVGNLFPLVPGPQIMLCDQPTSALDPEKVNEVLQDGQPPGITAFRKDVNFAAG